LFEEEMARRLLYAALAIGLVLAGINPAAARPTLSGRAAGNRADDRVAEIMAEMTPDEIVGQLFLVTFQGSDVGPDTAIADLVLRHHVGGVVLRAGDDNFTDEARLPQQVLRLTNGLQNLRYTGGPPPTAEPGGATREENAAVVGTFVPLFVALAQEGDGYPTSALHSGTTALPGAMALGATWRPADAEEIGRINGQELSALGVNMLLGPTSTCSTTRAPRRPAAPARAFGGDPYWVGLLGQAYIRGAHSGANGRIAIVSGKFPGTGGSDRATDQEVATVWRTSRSSAASTWRRLLR
jgi:beta-N-acetylhexosaminidase